MTVPEVLVLWVYMGAALFFAWQVGRLIGYWQVYGWPWGRKLHRWAARRHWEETETALTRWIEQHPEEAQRNLASTVASLGITSEQAIEAFAALGRELRSQA